jgi:hypothetical protein
MDHKTIADLLVMKVSMVDYCCAELSRDSMSNIACGCIVLSCPQHASACTSGPSKPISANRLSSANRPISISMSRITVNPRVVDLLKRTDGDTEESMIVAYHEEIQQIGIKEGWIKSMTIDCLRVGIHKKNRGGWGVMHSDCIDIGEGIDDNGFVRSAMVDASCFEDDLAHSNEDFTIDNNAKHEGLAQYTKGMIDFAAVGCSHTNQLWAAFKQRRPCDSLKLSDHGKLSPEKFIQKHPAASQVFEVGMTWWVYSRDAEVAYPTMPEMVERALNAKRMVAKNENCFGLLGRGAARISQMKAAGQTIDYVKVQKYLISVQPALKEHVPGIVNFAQKFCGTSGQFVGSLLAFIKMFMPVDQPIPSGIFEAVSSLKFNRSEDPAILFIYGIFKAVAVQQGKKNIIVASDVHTVTAGGKRHDRMMAANENMKLVRRFASSCGLNDESDPVWIKLIGRFDTCIVRFVFDKESKKYDSDAEVAYEAAEQIKSTTSLSIPNPFSVPTKPKTDESNRQTEPAVANVVELAPDGKVLNENILILHQKGVKVGCGCKPKKKEDGTSVSLVKSISGDGDVTMQGYEGDGTEKPLVTVPYDKFLQTYQIVKDFKLEKCEDWHKRLPNTSTQFNDMVTKSMVIVGLQSLVNEIAISEDIVIFEKPSKTVVAATAFKKGKLLLVPGTYRVSLVDSEPTSIFVCNENGKLTTNYIVLEAPKEADCISPAFWVKTTSDKSNANMEIIYKTVHCPKPTSIKTGNKWQPAGSVTIEYPILVNSKAVEKGTELVVFKEDKREKSMPVAQLQPAAKKRKVSE